ncbi:hypothetical protein Ddye_016162 [Dipteronia dyeriana]|uniref:Uncharacterized protein n=1 Tax=Dipteronia dyeriana TaxID=168575 RepID=A0AAD9U6W7_9ROSI|nr:hypothetical protein Ddye_016162 [Dipteronia dyeriana]
MMNPLFGYGLLRFIDGLHFYPPKTDQKHLFWLRYDRLVLLGIQDRVHSTIDYTINNCSTSADVLSKLETSYNNRMLSLLSTLMSTKKEVTSVVDYMNNMYSLVDELALIGYPLSDTYTTDHTLNGLADEFKELTTPVRVHDSPITFEDLYDKLLDKELIQKWGETKDDDTQITSQFYQKQNNYKGKGGKSNRGEPDLSHASNLGYSSHQPQFCQSNQQPNQFRPSQSHGHGYFS